MSRKSYNDEELEQASPKRYLPVGCEDLFANICSTSVKLLWATPSEALCSTIGTVAGDRIAFFTEVHRALSLSTRLLKYTSMQKLTP